MAKPISVWGVDLGQCALKALRCRVEDGRVIADAFDYIEYPKILSQPESEPEQMIQDALDQFLSRNEVKGHKVAISLPGQAGLARFFKPPPVEAKKIPEIVKYEARQQIPFPLDEVIWDFQHMGGGVEVEGVQIDSEVGLFAMKADQVHQLIAPYQEAGIELDIVQLSPFAIYNYVAHEINVVDDAEYDPGNPPESLVVLSMGTETTDLVVTNGVRVWQRSIPIGGNHFTKQLTKELKLTFAKAEQLKRNARKSEDPKKVFQAMSTVFRDLVNEVQRTVGFFQSLDRSAKIKGVMVMGNAVKLPGLQEYLSKNLGYEVVKFKGYEGVEKGSEVAEAPNFKDNAMAYGVSYGLCLQGLSQSRLHTNLIPREILTERLIRAKKPWVVATLGAIILACTLNTFFTKQQWQKVKAETAVGSVSWKQAQMDVQMASSTSNDHQQKHKSQKATLDLLTELGKEVVGNNDRRVLWLEVLRALNSALPQTEGVKPGEIPSVKELPFTKRKELYITRVETQHFEKLEDWFTDDVKQIYVRGRLSSIALAETLAKGQPAPPPPPAPDTPDADKGAAAAAPDGATPTPGPVTPPGPEEEPVSEEELARAGLATLEGPKGPGWVIEFTGHHFYNEDKQLVGDAHVRNTLIKKLEGTKVRLPITTDGTQFEEFSFKDLGIDFVIAARGSLDYRGKVENPDWTPDMDAGGGGGGMMGGGMMGGGMMGGGMMGGGMEGDSGAESEAGMSGSGVGGIGGLGGIGGGGPTQGAGKKGDDEVPRYLTVPKYDFVVQFVWQEKPLSERIETLKKEREEAKKKADEEAKKKAAAAKAAGGN